MRRVAKLDSATGDAPISTKVGDLLEPIIEFLRKAGLSKRQILAECNSAIGKSSRLGSKLDVVHVGFRKETIDIVNRWLRDPRYLNQNGRPDDLSLLGTRSISSLVKACQVAITPSLALAQLLEFGIVRNVGSRKYRLIRRSMDFAHSDYLPFEPNFRFLVDATRAATSRLRSSKTTHNLFWHCADNSRIHPQLTKDFLGFVRQRGLIFSHEINDWLDEHESTVKRSSRRTARLRRLGVGLFAIGSNED